jgi:hypothetical protein
VQNSPYRGTEPARSFPLPLPPARMPLWYRGRLLKRWRYGGAWNAELSLCAARVYVGPVVQEFAALWDRGSLWQRTWMLPGHVRWNGDALVVQDRDVWIDLTFDRGSSIEVVTPDAAAYTWTRKRSSRVSGTARIGGQQYAIASPGLIDDSAGYHARHTRWQWSAGAGKDLQGRAIAWNFTVGLHDSPQNSERTIWIDGTPTEIGPVHFAEDLSAVTFSEGGELHFTVEAVRQRHDNFILLQSTYRQPFGCFSGILPGGIELGEAYGVMEYHEALW